MDSRIGIMNYIIIAHDDYIVTDYIQVPTCASFILNRNSLILNSPGNNARPRRTTILVSVGTVESESFKRIISYS